MVSMSLYGQDLSENVLVMWVQSIFMIDGINCFFPITGKGRGKLAKKVHIQSYQCQSYLKKAICGFKNLHDL